MPRVGDLSTCFLLSEGWAFRVQVNSFQLMGKPGWQLPISVADWLGLERGERRELPANLDDLQHTLTISLEDQGCRGSEIGEPLRRVGAREGDMAFIVLRPTSYSIIVRKAEELRDADAVARMLWLAGLDPTSPEIREHAWQVLARVMGGEAGGLAAVRAR